MWTHNYVLGELARRALGVADRPALQKDHGITEEQAREATLALIRMQRDRSDSFVPFDPTRFAVPVLEMLVVEGWRAVHAQRGFARTRIGDAAERRSINAVKLEKFISGLRSWLKDLSD